MKATPLPAEFVTWLRAYVLSKHFTTPRSLHRGLVLRWGFWMDGVSQNKIPGYDTCPKPAPNGLPAGWSLRAFSDIAIETIGTAAVHAARTAAARTLVDCGSGYDYGICPQCGKGHGHVLILASKPTDLVTHS